MDSSSSHRRDHSAMVNCDPEARSINRTFPTKCQKRAFEEACSSSQPQEHEFIADRGFVLMSLVFPELLHLTVSYLDPEESHRLLVAPLCKAFFKQATCNELLWRAMCSSDPWCIPCTYLDGLCVCVLDSHHAGQSQPPDLCTDRQSHSSSEPSLSSTFGFLSFLPSSVHPFPAQTPPGCLERRFGSETGVCRSARFPESTKAQVLNGGRSGRLFAGMDAWDTSWRREQLRLCQEHPCDQSHRPPSSSSTSTSKANEVPVGRCLRCAGKSTVSQDPPFFSDFSEIPATCSHVDAEDTEEGEGPEAFVLKRCERSSCSAVALRRVHTLLVRDLRRVREASGASAAFSASQTASAAAATAAAVAAAYCTSNGSSGGGSSEDVVLPRSSRERGSAVGSRELASVDEQREEELLLAGVTLVGEVMTSHPIVVGIQAACLAALVPLLEAESARRQAQDSPLGHAVVAALRNFGNRIDVQHAALHALVLLARPLGGREGAVHVGVAPTLPALFGPRGGIRSVLEACMDRHPAEGGLQAMACWTLVNFALNGEAKRLLLQDDGMRRILSAMKGHPTHLAVQFRGLFALINLVVPEEPNTSAPHLELAVECVLAAMETFMSDTLLVNRGCLVLQNLSLNEHNHASLRRSRAREVLAESLARHRTQDSMLELSARATSLRLWPRNPDQPTSVGTVDTSVVPSTSV